MYFLFIMVICFMEVFVPIPVLVVQTFAIGFDAFEHELVTAKIILDLDCKVFRNPNDAEAFVVRGEPQVLVTGLIYDDQHTTDSFVRRMKEANPLLQVWWFSVVEPTAGLCERSIKKGFIGEYCKYLIPELQKFLASVIPIEL